MKSIAVLVNKGFSACKALRTLSGFFIHIGVWSCPFSFIFSSTSKQNFVSNGWQKEGNRGYSKKSSPTKISFLFFWGRRVMATITRCESQPNDYCILTTSRVQLCKVPLILGWSSYEPRLRVWKQRRAPPTLAPCPIRPLARTRPHHAPFVFQATPMLSRKVARRPECRKSTVKCVCV